MCGSKNATHIEKGSFIDLVTCVGNVEIFLYLIELATNQGLLLPEQSHKIVSRVIDLLKILLANDSSQNEICDFFSSDKNGLCILSHLLQVYMEKKGCSMDLANKIIDFTHFELARLAR
jgi:hypothetical protein